MEVYRNSERYSVWWHHHQQLLKADPTYAKETRRFSLMIWGSSLFACLFFFILSSAWPIVLNLGLAGTGWSAACVLIVRSEQHRRNAAIGRRLK